MKTRPKKSAMRAHRAGARAFTLVEIIIAMAIASMVVVGMSTLIFSMGELWGRNSDLRLYELHTRNVTRFIEGEFAAAALPPVGGTGGTQSTAGAGAAATGAAGATAPVTVQEVRDQSANTTPCITYELPNGSRICAWPDRAIPNVVCSLSYRPGTGLVLLWHSRLETNFDVDAPRETLISPLVTGLTYDYYDTETRVWKNEPVLRIDSGNAALLPQRLHIIFTYSGRVIETVVDIPGPPVQGLPML